MVSVRVVIKWLLLAVIVLLLGMGTWRWMNPTSDAYSKSDSPDGRYRCAIFDDLSECRFALFENGWRWRELPGERGRISRDSVGFHDIQYTWTGEQVRVTGRTGGATETVTGRIADGRQVWK
ncbi:MAG: hypothetical protein NTV86_11375 [Planctomycetota bacterium]|nr:hypothetical protein [Planctomycetota bacterium]